MLRALLAIVFLTSIASAQLGAPLGSSVKRQTFDTGWMPANHATLGALQCEEMAALNLRKPAHVVGVVEFRYAFEVENTSNAAVTNYQVGSGFEYHIAQEGLQVCSGACGGALAASDGQNYSCPVAHPNTNLGFAPGSDHHVMAVNMAIPHDFGMVPAGRSPILVGAYNGMQDWNGANATYPSHGWEYNLLYLEVRVRGDVLE